MTQTRSKKIDAIIADRQEKGKTIGKFQQWMWDVRNALTALNAAMAGTTLPPDSEQLVSRITALEKDLATDSASLEKVRCHFAKDTLSIAVVGQAGMGKSTFLQSLTGLSDDQIPASGGEACTSTQSCIHNLPGGAGPGYAEVFYYTRGEMLGFLSDCYSLLGWHAPSFLSMDDFARDFDAHQKPDSSALDYLWRLLKTYRDNAASLEHDLFGPALRSRRLSLSEVADAVTYAKGLSRPENLGIARVEIHCPFPSQDVGKLSVVDTPGMNAASEERDKVILEKVLDETADFVLFVGIPAERGISKNEQEMFDSCRRCARMFSDTPLDRKAFYVANQAIVRDPDTGQIRRNGADTKYNALWREAFESGIIPANRLVPVDAKDPDAVRASVLDPMVAYLVSTLPELDGAEVKSAEERMAAFRALLADLVRDVRDAFHLGKGIGQDDYRRLRDLYDATVSPFSAALQRCVDAHTPSVASDDDDDGATAPATPFTKAVGKIFQGYQANVGAEFPADRIELEMNSTAGQGGAAFFTLLSYLRCYIRDCFGGLENACRDMVESAKDDLAACFLAPFPNGGGLGKVPALLDPDGQPLHGTAFFKALADLATAAKAPTLAAQFQAFAGFELKFSGFIEHKVAKALAPLRQQSCDKVLDSLGIRLDYSNSQSIRTALLALGDRAANDVTLSLVQKSAAEPHEAIFAAIEDFVDRTRRQRGIEKEWIALYELLRVNVWPDTFDSASPANRAALLLRERLDALEHLSRAS